MNNTKPIRYGGASLPGAAFASLSTSNLRPPPALSRWWGGLALAGFCAWLASSAGAAEAAAKPKEKNDRPPIPKVRKNNLAPLPEGVKAAVSHAPFESGDCTLCHKNKDPQNPGPISSPVQEMCIGCHEEFQTVMARPFKHEAAKESCVNCHNPHNSKRPKLLVEETGALCLSCHTEIKALTIDAKVKHEALTKGDQCSNCHNPHGANVEHLLIKLAFDLCVNCHGKDGIKDEQGKTLTNFQKLLEENKEWHGPVSSKDCSACHNPHGGQNFRLLNEEYPAQFYSPYNPKLYALCFECHESTIVTDPETTTLTQFRNGKQNLHYVHVNKAERGRTCRACHEVHASVQKHQIRDSVPYGTRGWKLPINFTPTPTGGSCTKTCHETRSYTNTVAVVDPKPASGAPKK
jgi:predicted CXXCH cytochrome family protein